jgi:hypothetical protein
MFDVSGGSTSAAWVHGENETLSAIAAIKALVRCIVRGYVT